MKINAQELQPGDYLPGSKETVVRTVISSTSWPSNKMWVQLSKNGRTRSSIWGRYTKIAVERKASMKYCLESTTDEFGQRRFFVADENADWVAGPYSTYEQAADALFHIEERKQA